MKFLDQFTHKTELNVKSYVENKWKKVNNWANQIGQGVK